MGARVKNVYRGDNPKIGEKNNKVIVTAANDEEDDEHEEHEEDDAAHVGGGGDSDNQSLHQMAPIRVFGYIDQNREFTFIAYLRYHSDAIRLLKPTAAPSKVLKDWPLSGECERFKTTIAKSGLSTDAENSMLEHDRVAVSAFMERLYPESDTFHMRFGDMIITPDDAKQILNLNDHGVAVKYEYTKQVTWEKLYDLCKYCFGWDKETSDIEFNMCFSYKTRQFNMSKLINMLKGTAEKEKQGPLSDAEVDAVATAYLLCVLGCVIFPNASGNRVDANLLQLLHPLNKVADYSWGMACIAFLMTELSNASRLRTRQISWNMSLFQKWIYDHYPSLKLADVNTEWEKGTPRGTKYKFTKNRSRKKEHQVMRQHGYCQTVPWHHINGKFKLDVYRTRTPYIKVVYSSTPSVTEHWDKRLYHLVNTERDVNRGDENAPGYMEWYREHSHLRVICELKAKTTSVAAFYKCIVKEKPPGYDRLIKKHREMIDNVDNEEYAAEFGEKVTKNHPKKKTSKTIKRSQASSSSLAE
ncbi:uncharacterized protein LOC113329065 [Papaver somniferum]|uniref:uncharacterized protein LOC113329065 n=1 Tax=Papaver somniferum TaxID=3469 RepID=UPI000E6F5383|nr:uncharacterized protein LOC113329065 [Papaver somniferum]